MMKQSLGIASFAAASVALVLSAHAYDTSHLPYPDAPSDRATQVALSDLTASGIIMGNPDGTFRPTTKLNRAEFMVIAMRLQPNANVQPMANCFPDVLPNLWYTQSVCKAKALGIVSGNDYPNLPKSKWPFEPARQVHYEEVLKIMTNIYAVPTVSSTGEWYVPYIQSANKYDLGIDGLGAGDTVNRAEMVRIVAAYKAYGEGRLEEFRDAQKSSSSSSSRSSSSSSMSSSSTSSSSSSSSSTATGGVLDPNTDVSTNAKILVVGQTSPVLAASSIFLGQEPLQVRRISVQFANPVTSIDSVLIYDESRRFLGTATQDSNNSALYTLTIPTGTLTVPKSTETTVYARLRLKAATSGGASGETAQVTQIQVQGYGEWSQSSYTQNSTGTYNTFQTARAAITTVENAGDTTGVLVSGPNQRIGAFRFTAQSADNIAAPRLTGLTITVDQTNNVGLSNVRIVRQGTNVSSTCTFTTFQISCPTISSDVGALSSTPVVFEIYADVSLTDGNNATLRLRLNDPGSVGSPGAIAWTDGTTNFTWVAGASPLAQSTSFTR